MLNLRCLNYHIYFLGNNICVCLCTVNNLMTDVDCEADRNTQCKCKPGYYCTHLNDNQCEHCDPITLCPPGKGVTKNRKQYTVHFLFV